MRSASSIGLRIFFSERERNRIPLSMTIPALPVSESEASMS